MLHSQRVNSVIKQLVAEGLIQLTEEGAVATKRWQAAMMRAIKKVIEQGERREDIRIPVTLALLEIYGKRVSDAELLDLVMAMVSVEAKALDAQLSSDIDEEIKRQLDSRTH